MVTKLEVAFSRNAAMVRTGVKFSTGTMLLGYLGRGFISNLAKEPILEDMEALLLDRKIYEVLDFCMAADIFAAEDADLYIPKRASERVKHFALGRYLGHIFFSSLSAAFFGSDELMQKENFEALPRFWNPDRFSADLQSYEQAKADHLGPDSNVIHVPFGPPEDDLPELPETGMSEHLYCVIVKRSEPARVTLHVDKFLPVQGYQVADRLIRLESGFPDKTLDEEAALENTMYGLLLPIIRKVGFYVRRRRRNGFAMGTPPGGPYIIEETPVLS